MEELKKEMQAEQEVQTEQVKQAGQAEQAQPLTEDERKTVKKNFKQSVVIMALGFVLGYMLGRMVFTEVRVLAYVAGMVVSGLVGAVYIKK
ncbi:MAG: hypothetical protein PUC76_02630 [Clostridia bacterium]|nr:hypothetical protein [Clostridia bacterium]